MGYRCVPVEQLGGTFRTVAATILHGFCLVSLNGAPGFAVCCLTLVLAGCAGDGSLDRNAFEDEVFARPAGLQQAQQQFKAGSYGKAIEAYQVLIEQDPRDAEAWLGLAACYDEARRFDLADKSYARLLSLTGETPEVLNNMGYSYYLRGDLPKSKKTLLAAYRLAPQNANVRNNIELLNAKLEGAGLATITF
jgi:Flp pilus assembly protein TadD